ncbi:MAG: glutamate--tRNA ligase [Gammaproteobacteria bacterium]|nr:glutamate--tRNA ligase [Gammaproteobacteria bacterium]
MSIRTRFAPSPTGYLHIGGARTALFAWLYARKHGGKFVLRIEDTDLERSTEESVNAILEGMSWMGLDYDEGPFYQTHRFERYEEVIQQLLNDGKAYRCSCSKDRLEKLREDQMAAKEKPRYDGHCRNQTVSADEPHVIRFLNPQDGEVVFKDLVRGSVTVQNKELDDLIIKRTDGSPTYNLSVVVDDLDMKISHVIRGDDHINNTPRQINILNAMGHEAPTYAHVPMILGEDGARLSKRHGATSVVDYREMGFLPEALMNYLVRLGWSSGDKELFTLDEMISLFDVVDVNKAPSTFNYEKLKWINAQYIREEEPSRIAQLLSVHLGNLGIDPSTGPALEEVVVAQRERAQTLIELAEVSQFYYRDFDEFDENMAKKQLRPVAAEVLKAAQTKLNTLDDWNIEPIHDVIHAVAEELDIKMGKVGTPLRVAVTGGAPSPSLDLTIYLIGKEACDRRINKALEYITNRSDS